MLLHAGVYVDKPAAVGGRCGAGVLSCPAEGAGWWADDLKNAEDIRALLILHCHWHAQQGGAKVRDSAYGQSEFLNCRARSESCESPARGNGEN